ncbi:MAG TPA: histone deacetylase [Leptolyngbyaceae cyanobacterium M33_DOE_097]|uniref:Histone deacetylase n=1 Tax=Oscillatoriales cyanobacterium SpSt-418 TaxID=2282169 RepID=A0A7C3PB35_9CYAN|nr:histone deacetylase [Leptolyngbyaceae cyanobacterium M33_DOE_097]
MLPVIYSDEFLMHDTGDFHPERPARLTAIKQALEATPWSSQLEWRKPTPIEQRPVLEAVQQVHDPSYVNGVRILANRGGGYLDGDTPISHRSYEVAMLAVSAWLDGVDEVLHSGKPVFVLARPPGHHATKNVGMGFCLFSNAAIAAHYALQQAGINKVAILDWDVHHGNGTQDLVERNPQLAYCSLHEFPNYPGTGNATEQGFHQNVLNVPMAPGSAMPDYDQAFQSQVMPFLEAFQPDLLIVSAGYDATAADPLSRICLLPTDFGVFSRYCLQFTSKILFGLEGGYDLEAIAQAVVATLEPCVA